WEVHAVSDNAQPGAGFGGRGSGTNSRSGRSDLPLTQRNYAERFRRLGAGARTVFHVAVGFKLYPVAGIARSRRGRTERWAAGGALRQRYLHLHGVRVLSAVACGRAGSGAVVCESDKRSLVDGRWSIVVGDRSCHGLRCSDCKNKFVILNNAKDLLFAASNPRAASQGLTTI